MSFPSTSGRAVNCFALLSRNNRCVFHTTEQSINAATVGDYLDQFSRHLKKPTVVVLDNAPVHQKQVKARRAMWEAKGLYVFFLPTYSPHLNIVEILWKRLKYDWLQPSDYAEKSLLCYRVWQTLSAVGRELKITFKPFSNYKLN